MDHSIRRELTALLPQMRRFARSLAGNPHDADDIVQIALERALTRSEQFTPDTNLKSWVYRIMKNAWLDELRSRGRRAQVVLPEEAGETQGSWSTDEDIGFQELLEVLADLPEQQRIVVGMVLVEGLSYHEAAEILDIPVGTVTSRLARARMALISLLAADGRAT